MKLGPITTLTARQKRIAAYVLLAIVGTLGLFRVEGDADRAHSAANRASERANFVQQQADAEKAAQQQKDHDNCMATNNARVGIRQAFTDLINQAFAVQPQQERTPEEQARVDQSRTQFINDFLAKNLDVNLPIVDCDAKFPTK